jgi:hypothetical protein
MSRFTITKRANGQSSLRVMTLQNAPNLRAFFDYQDNESGLTLRDWKLMTGVNGPFVNSPTGKPYKGPDGADVHPKLVQATYDASASSKRSPAGDAYFQELCDVAVAEFEAQGGSIEPARRAGGGQGRGQGRGGGTPSGQGRSAVPKTRTNDFEDFPGSLNDEDDDLPF